MDGNGFWDVGSNWSTGSVPGTSDDVVIDRAAGNFTITHRTGTTTVNSLTSAEKIVLSGGSVTTANPVQISDILTLQGGSLENTTIQTSGGAKLVATNQWGTLNGVTLNGDLDLSGNSAGVTVVNGLTLNGTTNLSGDSSRLEFAGTQTLAGTECQIWEQHSRGLISR